MKFLSEQKALRRLNKIKAEFKSQISERYEHKAKSCLTCEVQGSCCLDAHFVNVHVSRLEAAAIKKALARLPETSRRKVNTRVKETIEKYGLKTEGDTFARTFACPLFEKGIGCLIHHDGKPLPCITHACYDNAADLPPSDLQTAAEDRVDALNTQTYRYSHAWLPLPIAIR